MSVLFQFPALLGLLALALVPPLVHLLSRARPPTYRFSDLEFLRRAMRTTTRLRRPKDWILLLLRTLAIAALALAFAAPLLVSRNALLPGERPAVVLLVDRSASMAAAEGAGTRFDAACAQAARYLDQANPRLANLIWIAALPEAVFPDPGPNVTFLAERMQQARPLPEEGALTAAFDLALRQLAGLQGRRELVVISDFQSAAWRDFSPVLPPGIQVRAQRVAAETPANIAITRLIAQPAVPVIGQEVTLLVQARNFSGEAVNARITLDAGGALQTQTVPVAAWGDSQVAFQVRPAAAGVLPVTATLDASSDRFPSDNARHVALRVREALRLSVDAPAESPERMLLGRMASALSWLELAPPTAGGEPPDFRFIAAWKGEGAEAILQSAADGVLHIVRPAAGCPVASLRQLLGQAAALADGSLALDASPVGWSVAPEEEHRAHQIFKSGHFGNPYAGNFRERLKWPEPYAGGEVRQVARYSDGLPALLERTTSGASVLLWNLPLDPAKSDWPARASFLPAMAELLLRLRPGTSGDPAAGRPGHPVVWTPGRSDQADACTLVHPEGRTIPAAETLLPAGPVWMAKDPAVPGIYRWMAYGQGVAATAVNFPETESDLRCLDALPAFGDLGATGNALARQIALDQGVPLWPYLIVLALLALAAESLLHLRSVRASPARAEAGTVPASPGASE